LLLLYFVRQVARPPKAESIGADLAERSEA
jgi:hypothetical protein